MNRLKYFFAWAVSVGMLIHMPAIALDYYGSSTIFTNMYNANASTWALNATYRNKSASKLSIPRSSTSAATVPNAPRPVRALAPCDGSGEVVVAEKLLNALMVAPEKHASAAVGMKKMLDRYPEVYLRSKELPANDCATALTTHISVAHALATAGRLSTARSHNAIYQQVSRALESSSFSGMSPAERKAFYQANVIGMMTVHAYYLSGVQEQDRRKVTKARELAAASFESLLGSAPSAFLIDDSGIHVR